MRLGVLIEHVAIDYELVATELMTESGVTAVTLR